MNLFEKYKLKCPAEFTRLVGVNFGTFQIILESNHSPQSRMQDISDFAKNAIEENIKIMRRLGNWR